MSDNQETLTETNELKRKSEDGVVDKFLTNESDLTTSQNSKGHNAKNSHFTKEIKSGNSIFYDPDWNPTGDAPLGLKNVYYNKNTFTVKGRPVEPITRGLENIPLPETIKEQSKK